MSQSQGGNLPTTTGTFSDWPPEFYNNLAPPHQIHGPVAPPVHAINAASHDFLHPPSGRVIDANQLALRNRQGFPYHPQFSFQPPLPQGVRLNAGFGSPAPFNSAPGDSVSSDSQSTHNFNFTPDPHPLPDMQGHVPMVRHRDSARQMAPTSDARISTGGTPSADDEALARSVLLRKHCDKIYVLAQATGEPLLVVMNWLRQEIDLQSDTSSRKRQRKARVTGSSSRQGSTHGLASDYSRFGDLVPDQARRIQGLADATDSNLEQILQELESLIDLGNYGGFAWPDLPNAPDDEDTKKFIAFVDEAARKSCNARRSSRDSKDAPNEILKCLRSECQASFSNKSSWLRHVQQMIPYELFKCPEPGCDFIERRREWIKNHLKSATRGHNLSDEQVDARLGTGRQRAVRGFIVPFNRQCGWCKPFQTDSWQLYFEHIYNHFLGQGGLEQKTKDDWEGPYPPEQIPSSRRRGTLTPGFTGHTADSDDDDNEEENTGGPGSSRQPFGLSSSGRSYAAVSSSRMVPGNLPGYQTPSSYRSHGQGTGLGAVNNQQVFLGPQTPRSAPSSMPAPANLRNDEDVEAVATVPLASALGPGHRDHPNESHVDRHDVRSLNQAAIDKARIIESQLLSGTGGWMDADYLGSSDSNLQRASRALISPRSYQRLISEDDRKRSPYQGRYPPLLHSSSSLSSSGTDHRLALAC